MDPLIARCQAGEEAAYRELFLRHRTEVARIVVRTIGKSSDLEDVVQEVFIQVFRSLRSFRGESKFSTWLYRLTLNVSRMHIRKLASRPRLAHGDIPEWKHTAPRGDAPDAQAERSEHLQALRRLVMGLSDKKGTVLILHDFQGLSPAEISEIVEAPVLTVRTRLFYARKELYAAIALDAVLAPHVESLMKELSGRDSRTASDARESLP